MNRKRMFLAVGGLAAVGTLGVGVGAASAQTADHAS